MAIFLGFKILTQIFLFISQWNMSSQVTVKDDFIPPSPPQLILPVEATNSAKLTIMGYSEPGATVFITQNSEPVENVVVSDEGKFVIADIELAEGANEFSAVAVDPAGNESQPFEPKTVFYLNKPPKLTIATPTDKQKVSGRDNFIDIKGLTDEGVKLTINDRQIVVTNTGNFSYRFTLAPGENQIWVQASDRAGNAMREELVVIYEQ